MAAAEMSVGVISLISDDEEDAALDSSERRTHNGDHQESHFLSQFLRKYGGGGEPAAELEDVADAVRACSQRPFCLYLYGGVELSGKQTTSVVLVGYLDQNLGASVVRPLLTLQMSGDTPRGAAPPRGLPPLCSDASRLMEALRKLDLRLANLAVFYCDAPAPSASWVLVSQLRRRSPGLVSLCGINAIAARACQTGFSVSFGGALTLIREVHRYCSAHASAACPLKDLFEGAGRYDPSAAVSANCSFIICAVQKMARCWKRLVDYFKSVAQTGEAEWIRSQLRDPRVKLEFLFLSQVLQPLGVLQNQQQSSGAAAAAGLVDQLQTIPMVLQAYADSILRPAPRQRSLWELQCSQDLLPPKEVNVGHLAREFLWATPAVDLGEADRGRFLRSAQAFHKAVLQSLVESVPKPLEEAALRSIAVVLNQPESLLENDSYRRVLPALGVQFGLCAAGSLEAQQLASDFFSLLQTELRKPTVEDGQDGRWAKMLERMRPTPLHRLLLTLLALPASLRRTSVFAKMSGSSKALCERQSAPGASPRPAPWSRRAGQPWRRPGAARLRPADPARGYRNTAQSDSDTDNSSDVVEVVEEASESSLDSSRKSSSEHQVILTLSSEDDDASMDAGESADGDGAGDLVWGVMEGFPPWPAVTLSRRRARHDPDTRLVQWFGQGFSSEVRRDRLSPFTDFVQNFCQQSFSVLVTYREAVSLALQEAALRRVKQFSPAPETEEEKLRQMIDWAFQEFQSAPPDQRQPARDGGRQSHATTTLFPRPPSSVDSPGLLRTVKEVSVSLTRLSCDAVEKRPDASRTAAAFRASDESRRRDEADQGRGRGRGGKAQRKRSSLPDRLDNNASPRFSSSRKKINQSRAISRGNRETSVYQQPDQKLREETIRRIMEQNLDIEGFCLCCGTQNVTISHPLFKGSLCLKCKDNFTETLYRYDDDGYQSYCTVCCYGLEVVLCGNTSCCRSYCGDCVNILVGRGAFDSLKRLDPWICYLCQPQQAHGALQPRPDWSVRVQTLFADHGDMEFEPHRVYPCVPASLRRPLRVLSLFDGIATGYVVLKELGLKLDRYVASEVCEDSIAVSTINHDGKIVHVGDVRHITKEHLDRWGPFDLLIGGSPCNDLSIVNPFRKGLYEGTGRLFFDFYRVLLLLRPGDDDPRPFFWMFENVVFMNTHDRVNICRFLECNPVLVDAVTVSPAHRARYFWGNIPGMNRPIIASQSDRLNLQDCLELGRTARVAKVRTITTNPNSLKQGKNQDWLPILQNGREDSLWVTELERIFGFPKHYTDVRNMNCKQRQKVLGKAWSVPVVRHLLAPLKDYFACEELLPAAGSTSCSSSGSSGNSSSPSSPDVQLLR